MLKPHSASRLISVFRCVCIIGVVGFHSSGIFAQSSQDSWDSRFNPQAVQERKQERYQQWLASWKDRDCSATDVKNYWYLKLLQPLPDSMDASYSRIVRQNDQLEADLASTASNFQAQDIADQINIMRLRKAGDAAGAEALERTRLERRRIHEQEQYQAKMLAQQDQMRRELELQMQQLQLQVWEAKRAADAARRAAESANY
jgi:hypothetical protein